MKPLFRPGLNQPGTKLFKGFEPGRRRFLWSPALSAATPVRRCLAQQRQCTSQKILKGWSPEKMLPLTLGNRDEDNMRAAD
jgi:hypothetical protein